MAKGVLIWLLIFLPVVLADAQEFRVMFYNTENLFDTADDSLRDDSEFLPEGERRWTETRYKQKIDAVSRVIVAAGEWEAPLFVGLAEVENERVLKDLIHSSLLINSGYGIVHRESPDRRGIDLCLIYRKDYVSVLEVRSWVPEPDEGKTFDSRNLLYVKGLVFGDTLHLILCHLPSRRGGVLNADVIRKDVMTLLGCKTDSLILASGGRGSVMVMGDFNMGPDDQLVTRYASESNMKNLSARVAGEGTGTYKYQGRWEVIDQMIVSQVMTGDGGHFRAGAGSFKILDTPFLLEDDPGYPGMRPRSTYRNYKWAGGYSDHLPVILTITHL